VEREEKMRSKQGGKWAATMTAVYTDVRCKHLTLHQAQLRPRCGDFFGDHATAAGKLALQFEW